MLNYLKDYTKKLKRTKIILISRKDTVAQEDLRSSNEDFQIYEIKPFSVNEASEFFYGLVRKNFLGVE